MLKLRLLWGQAPYGTARTGAGGAGLGPERAASSPAKGGTAYPPAPASGQPSSPGLSPQLISLPIWDATAEGLKTGLGSGAKSMAGRAEPWLAQPSTGALRIGISLGWHERLITGLARVLAGCSCPVVMTWSLTNPKLGNQSPKREDYSLSWTPCKASARL